MTCRPHLRPTPYVVIGNIYFVMSISNLVSILIFSSIGLFWNIFLMTSSTTPLSYTLIFIWNIYFRDFHIELSPHTNFHLEWTILKFSITSPTTPFWTDRQTNDKCILGTRQPWQIHPRNSSSLAKRSAKKVPQNIQFPTTNPNTQCLQGGHNFTPQISRHSQDYQDQIEQNIKAFHSQFFLDIGQSLEDRNFSYLIRTINIQGTCFIFWNFHFWHKTNKNKNIFNGHFQKTNDKKWRLWPNYTKYKENIKTSRPLLQYQDKIKKKSRLVVNTGLDLSMVMSMDYNDHRRGDQGVTTSLDISL